MKRFRLILIACLASYFAQGQCLFIDAEYAVLPVATVTYETETRINPVDGTRYGTPIPVQMDIYRPANLPAGTARPVVILNHGNGRRRNSPEWVAMAMSLARRGYVVASIDYRADFFTPMEILIANLACTTAPCKLAASNRTLYSNAMDVHKAIDYLLANQVTHQVDPNKFILAGHSLGGGTAFYASTVSKPEVSAYFPATFLTDAWYTNLDVLRPRIRGAILLSGATTDLSYVDPTDNVPLFIYHGTHDPLAPFYAGRQLCGDATNPVLYGGAAIAERVDAFSNYSYYFVEARGVGHVTSVTCTITEQPNPADALGMLWYPDMLRFVKTTMIDGFPNQIFKKVTPNNTSPYDYCAGATNSYCNGNANDFLLQFVSSGGTCYSFPVNWPNNTLGTLPWSGPAYQSCSYPAIFPGAEAPCGPNGWYLKQENADIWTQGVTQDAHVIAEESLVVPSAAFSLSPNPSNGHFTLRFDGPIESGLRLEVIDAQGGLVWQGEAPIGDSEMGMDLSGQPAGIYFLRIVSGNGRSTTRKLFKH